MFKLNKFLDKITIKNEDKIRKKRKGSKKPSTKTLLSLRKISRRLNIV